MHALISQLTFEDESAASAEAAEMEAQADEISRLAGFEALLVVRVAAREVVIVRVFETPDGVGRSLTGPLRPDLAARFAATPIRSAGEVVVARFGAPEAR